MVDRYENIFFIRGFLRRGIGEFFFVRELLEN